MGRVAEMLADELENISRLTREETDKVHREWKEQESAGMSFGEFVLMKSQKRTKKQRL